MFRQGLIAILAALTLSGCFDTVTRLTNGGSFAGAVRDGLYYQVCRGENGIGRLTADSAMIIAAKPLPDGRTGVEIRGETTLLGEVLPLLPGVQLVGIKEGDKATFENFLVITAAGETGAFATVTVGEEVEKRIKAADAIGDAAAIRALLVEALAARRYEIRTTYVVVDLLRPAADGTTPLPPALGPLAEAVGQAIPGCD